MERGLVHWRHTSVATFPMDKMPNSFKLFTDRLGRFGTRDTETKKGFDALDGRRAADMLEESTTGFFDHYLRMPAERLTDEYLNELAGALITGSAGKEQLTGVLKNLESLAKMKGFEEAARLLTFVNERGRALADKGIEVENA